MKLIKSIVTMVIVFSLITTCLISCSSQSDSSEYLGLPRYEKATYETVKENRILLKGITKDDFYAYVELLKQDGYAFDDSIGDITEESALSMDFWQGKKNNEILTLFLMLDLETNTNSIEVTKNIE